MKPGPVFIYAVMVVAVGALLVGVWLRFWPDIDIGKRLAENNCGSCHKLTSTSLTEDAPPLLGVVGRVAGTMAFPYSPTFRKQVAKSPFRWDETQLDRFITDPNQVIPQTRMVQRSERHPRSFDGIVSSANRKDLIAYLKTLK